MRLLGSVVLLPALAAAVRRQPRRATPAAPSSAVAEVLAGIINDAAAGVAGLLALAMVARDDWRMLAGAVLFAILVSVPSVRRIRLTLRRSKLSMAATAVLVAISIALLSLSDPSVARTAGGIASAAIVATAFALVVLWRAPLLSQLRPFRGSPPTIRPE